MRQVWPTGSIFFYQCTSLVVPQAQPGIPTDVSTITVLILDTCRPALPCLSHRAPVPFAQRPRRARSIGFRAGGRSHNRPPLFGDLQHEKAIERPIPIAAPVWIFAIDESTHFQGVERRASPFVDQLAQVQLGIER